MVIKVTIPHDEEVRKMLEGKSWVELAPEITDLLFGDLILLKPDALRYYFPAFLRRAVESKNEHHIELLVDSLDPRFTPDESISPSVVEWRRAWAENLERFSAAQSEMIRDFVEWASTRDEVDLNARVLEYWKRPR